ncbi:substrate-binding domain-containing protein, partial [Enterocloster clostridioformis]
NNYYKELKYPRVINNDYKCARELIGLLTQAGHKNIAGIFVYDNYQSIEKFRGYVSALRSAGIVFEDDYVKWCISNEAHSDGFYKEIGKFLKSLQKCTAVVCCNYMILQSVLASLKEMKKNVPEDYSLVCFDYSNKDWKETGITCSIHPGYEMGVLVGSRLMQMIRQKDYSDNGYSYLMKPRIYEGRSIRVIR